MCSNGFQALLSSPIAQLLMLFTLLRCLRVIKSSLMMYFYRHFKSPLSWLKLTIISFHQTHFILYFFKFHIIFNWGLFLSFLFSYFLSFFLNLPLIASILRLTICNAFAEVKWTRFFIVVSGFFVNFRVYYPDIRLAVNWIQCVYLEPVNLLSKSEATAYVVVTICTCF